MARWRERPPQIVTPAKRQREPGSGRSGRPADRPRLFQRTARISKWHGTMPLAGGPPDTHFVLVRGPARHIRADPAGPQRAPAVRNGPERCETVRNGHQRAGQGRNGHKRTGRVSTGNRRSAVSGKKGYG